MTPYEALRAETAMQQSEVFFAPARFREFLDEELDDIARAFGAAWEEGERAEPELLREVAREYGYRRRDVPLPHGWGSQKWYDWA